MHDVAVIGGGVAGLAAVRALQLAGIVPLLIARSGRRAPSLGETLGPSAGQALERLQWRDLLDDRAIACAVDSKFSVWGAPVLARQNPPGAPGGFGWHVDRRRLEAEMRSRMQTTPVKQMNGGVRRVERVPDGWRLELPTGSVTARFIIDASGRASVVGRTIGEIRRLDRLVAAYGVFAVEDAEMHHASLVDAAPNGWWYTAPMPDGRLFVAFFSDADLLPGDLTRDPAVWSVLLNAAPDATRARLTSLGIVAEGPAHGIADAGTVLPVQACGQGWAAAGDAAAALDPLASHGLAVAFWSGERAANAAAAILQGDAAPLDDYGVSMARGLARFSDGHRLRYGAERRYLDQPFWQRRVDALQLSSPPA